MAKELEEVVEKEEEKEETKPNPDLVDERGVSWKNVAKETARKLEAFEAEIVSLKTQMSQTREPEPKPESADPKELVDLFVKDPMGFVDDVVEKRLAERERGQAQARAVEYIQTQKDYDPNDDARVLAIVSEYELMGLTPIARAKSAIKILRREKELLSLTKKDKAEEKRTKEIAEEMGEGVGRTAPPATSKKRDEILKQIAKTDNPKEMAELAEMLRGST